MTDVDDFDRAVVFQHAVEDLEIVALDGLGANSRKARSLRRVWRVPNMLYGNFDHRHDVCTA